MLVRGSELSYIAGINSTLCVSIRWWRRAWRPLRCGPGDPPGCRPGDPPGCRTGGPPGQTPQPAPLGVVLETPPPSKTPQAPNWVWARKPARHAGIHTPGDLQGMLGYHLQAMLACFPL